MQSPKNPLLLPFANLQPEVQAKIANELFNKLEHLIFDNKSDEISALRLKMHEQYGMSNGVFQQYVEEIFNTQVQTLIDPQGNDIEKLKFFLTVVPITFIPDHDVEEDVIFPSYLGQGNDEWCQELISTMISAGYLHGQDVHYAAPVLFDINELFETPECAFKIISNVISGELASKYPPKDIILTKEEFVQTRYFVIATGSRDLKRPSAIIPSIEDCFTQFDDMKKTMESIVNHYWHENTHEQFEACPIVGPAIAGASGLRLKFPSDMMGCLSFHLIKQIQKMEKRDLKVVVDKNVNEKSLVVNLYIQNTCVFSFKYPKLQLAEGFEIAMMGYALDTVGLSHYRVIETESKLDPAERMKQPLLRVVE